MKKTILSAAGALLLGGYASAADILVPADQPTIQAAVDAAMTDDRIVLENASYTESATVAKQISIVAADGVEPTLFTPTGTTPAITVGSGAVLIIDGVNFDGSNNDDEFFPQEVNNIQMEGGARLTVRNADFNLSTLFHIGDDTVHSSPIELIVEDCTFRNNIDDAIRVSDDNTAAANVIELRRSTFFDARSDMVKIEPINGGASLIVDECFFYDQNDGEALQLGWANGTIDIMNSCFFNIEDSAIELDNDGVAVGSVVVTITNNTIVGCNTGINVDDMQTITSLTATYNIFSDWDESQTGGDPEKGHGYSNFTDVPAVSDFNVFADNSTQNYLNVTPGPNDVIVAGSDLTGVLCNFADVSDPDFFKVVTGGAAFDIDGMETNAGCSQDECPADVDSWTDFAY